MSLGSTSASEMTIGTGGELEVLSGSRDEVESQSSDSRAREGEGGGG
jgi:hypothetical protein